MFEPYRTERDKRGVSFHHELADLKDFQLVSISGLTATIIAVFGFRIGLLYEFDSTPQMGREKNDATLTSNLMYSFGN